MSEAALWAATRKHLRRADLMRVENSVCPGTPDVNGCYRGVEFWIELKKVPRPRRTTTPVRIPHFTPQQRAWIKRRGRRAFVLLQVGRAYFLHGPEDVDALGGLTYDEHWQRARLAWSQKEKHRWQEVLKHLTTT